MKKIVSAILVTVLVLALGSAAYAYADYGIVVTQNPAGGTWAEGSDASFYAGAQYYSTMEWAFADPCGIEHPVKEFLEMVPGVTVEGEYTTMLTIHNVTDDLDGWAVFCRFHSSIDNTKTRWAFIHVADAVPVYGVNPYLGY